MNGIIRNNSGVDIKLIGDTEFILKDNRGIEFKCYRDGNMSIVIPMENASKYTIRKHDLENKLKRTITTLESGYLKIIDIDCDIIDDLYIVEIDSCVKYILSTDITIRDLLDN